jgi:hypothetical protein
LREIASQVGRCSASSFRQIIGLGADAASVDLLVTWPRAGTLQSRRDLYLGMEIPEDGHFELHDDIFARPIPPEESVLTISAGSPFDLPIEGADIPGAPSLATIVSGPPWISLSGSGATGWGLAGTSPGAGEAADSYEVELLFQDPGVPGAASKSRVRFEVLIPPFIETVTVRGRGRKFLLVGGHFPLTGLTATVNGVPARKVKVVKKRALQDDGRATLASFRAPLKRRAIRGGLLTVVVTDTTRGAVSPPYEYMAPP